MRTIIFILGISLPSLFCQAQNKVKAEVDSMSGIARNKADKILVTVDSGATEKLLYSISDERYLVALKWGQSYQQYFLSTDNAGEILEKRKIETSENDIAILSKAFDYNNYRKDFVTKVDTANVAQGNLSYFVAKDLNDTRYGEYSLSVITVPVPIDEKLYVYLVQRLLKESTFNIKKEAAH